MFSELLTTYYELRYPNESICSHSESRTLGAGLSPLVIAWLGEAFGLGAAISLMALLYLIGVILVMATGSEQREYAYLAGYSILQYVLLATAWNVLGGYTGYVNFGVAAFFAVGCYSTVALRELFEEAPLYVTAPVGVLVAALLGLGTGYLTLRLRGVFFSIATLALAAVLQTLVIQWDLVGGARGGGGSNFSGSYSGTASVTPEVETFQVIPPVGA